ncbi:thioesterase II family protein [Cryptosporangium arvum]|uniref:Putative thioesterase involved in non-ribosomal peptide biosynthesis n=1 Tax=Cryptosporangium arvum DSM 44712 TaxID=927661 RepID=A0A010ZY57_9ACTN|nr:alpha/beta fold hydrolase [Cryptosporangium arvum]EXG82147.1 putative thioesterase involved in non-ribosomal peptide biosynthesis [Cryptosporangium arvum DSM 44712]
MTISDTATTSWIRRYKPTEGADVRLVCFPHAGGSASYFNSVAARFSPGVDVVALQYPGRQDRRREPVLRDLGELADLVTAELLRLREVPTVFFGHSMGAVLAFECAWRMEEKGLADPQTLLLSGRRAPSALRDEQTYRGDDARLLAELRQLNGTSSALLEDDDILRMALDTLRGDLEAVETYVDSGHRVTVPLVVLTGDDDPKTTVTEAQRWCEHTESTCRVLTYPGGHFYLDRHAAAVGDVVAAELAKVRPTTIGAH